ncbi:MAG: DUF3372 domain-containing protein [Myxococcales bacterium]|nr:DUF3372 domain-containing protein [Myxococcales bacterium]
MGLPNAEKDSPNYEVIGSILADASIAPMPSDIASTVSHLREVLRIRYSSVLFRLRTGAEVMQRVDFHNVGSSQQHGLIAMTVTDGTCAGEDLDPAHEGVVILFNASNEAKSLVLPFATGMTLHPVHATSADPRVKDATFEESTHTFSVPPLTTAVFVKPQSGAQGEGLPCNTR